MPNRNDSSGLPNPMPKAPGNRKAGQPPSRQEAGGALPRWLDSSEAKWTRERVGQIDKRLTSRAGRFYVGEPQLKTIPAYYVR
jgi:hypothetical protein